MQIGNSKRIRLGCRLWAFNGLFRSKSEALIVEWPQEAGTPVLGSIPITQPSVYPLGYGEKGLRERLIKRGSMLWSCRFRKFVGYNAPTCTRRTSGTYTMTNPILRTLIPLLIPSRYMVDMATYHELHQDNDSGQDAMGKDDIGKTAMQSNEPPSDDFLLCLPAKVPAYWFLKKRWVTLNVRNITDVVWEESAFETLVLDAHKKEMLKALVATHDLDMQPLDSIEDKGNALTLLLHGLPGTGKTLTAEGIAELTHKPLYRPAIVEKYLDSVLHIVRTWGCVVLLDEADMFLEDRTLADLERKALVSIFLRVLEYYEGILILTTNRVGMFDEAFKSRVQLAIHFPSLGQEQRLQIWSNFIKSMESEVDTRGIRKMYTILSMAHLNERQIRNTIKTARQLALFKKEAMGYTHLQETIKISNEFEDYMQQAMGQTHAQRAVDTCMRAPEPTE
ncbi:P-loop containing nucleoside triphosphate hydrolase protein [Aureobasidium pullulans]|uniref:P-loop containing nucleoside triphosphate hydrolase protein n=1 Tax=Aureobasidium pullulans TaxID=5580 RepID=A0A4S9DSU7_AURPU|nr:P-loop containing nucleoside triphosphate hydrolase protein [Aureobasidium pullulans]